MMRRNAAVIMMLAVLAFGALGYSLVSAATEMVTITGGCFMMGRSNAVDAAKDEGPAHEVCVADFQLDAKEVTQADFQASMGSNPSKYKGLTRPVDSVTWDEAVEYCSKLGLKLPTEAQWEYAARGGASGTVYPGTASFTSVTDFGWIWSNSGATSHPVGSKLPTAFGLYDMAGNVEEWTSDWYAADYYTTSPKDNPTGPATGTERVVRGSSWCEDIADETLVTRREPKKPDTRSDAVGFRCAK